MSAVENFTERSGFCFVCYGAGRFGYPLVPEYNDCYGADTRRYNNHGTVWLDLAIPEHILTTNPPTGCCATIKRHKTREKTTETVE